MKEAAKIFLKWWTAMAVLYERYGPTKDIEEVPEWSEVLQLQRGWIAELCARTGSDEETLFEATQAAISQVLGDTSDVAISLTLDQAEEIMRTAVDLTVAAEMVQAEVAGMVN